MPSADPVNITMPQEAFSIRIPIHFSHSDPAGMVYFPNYFDMFANAIEEWFAADLGVSYNDMVLKQRFGFPIVHAECDFYIPSRAGENLDLTMVVTEIGRSKLRLDIHGGVGGQQRLKASIVIVMINLDSGKSNPFPEDLRKHLEAYKIRCAPG